MSFVFQHRLTRVYIAKNGFTGDLEEARKYFFPDKLRALTWVHKAPVFQDFEPYTPDEALAKYVLEL